MRLARGQFDRSHRTKPSLASLPLYATSSYNCDNNDDSSIKAKPGIITVDMLHPGIMYDKNNNNFDNDNDINNN